MKVFFKEKSAVETLCDVNFNCQYMSVLPLFINVLRASLAPNLPSLIIKANHAIGGNRYQVLREGEKVEGVIGE